MAYQKQDWHNLPSEDTPISAERLSHMEDGIYNSLQEDNIAETINDSSKLVTTDIVKDYVDGKNTYSETETKIGTWIDGKPLYRRVIPIDNTIVVNANTWTPIRNVSSFNISKLTDVRILTFQAKTGLWNILTEINGDYLSIYSYTAIGYMDYVILEYTKTDD